MGSPEARPAEHEGRGVAPGRLYERIGVGYSRHRRADPRIAAQLDAAVGPAERVLNVGAGTGSYEPRRRRVVAIEPSAVMLAQRPTSAAPVAGAVAEALPIASRSFDVAMAILTLQHWTDPRRGIAELRRAADRQVILHFEPGHPFWLIEDYLPELRGLEIGRVPSVADVQAMLGGARIEPVLVPADCTDGFFSAYWRRPEAYLDPSVRASISYLARLDAPTLQPGLERLRADLATGAWYERHHDLIDRDEYDGGYRLLIRD